MLGMHPCVSICFVVKLGCCSLVIELKFTKLKCFWFCNSNWNSLLALLHYVHTISIVIEKNKLIPTSAHPSLVRQLMINQNETLINQHRRCLIPNNIDHSSENRKDRNGASTILLIKHVIWQSLLGLLSRQPAMWSSLFSLQLLDVKMGHRYRSPYNCSQGDMPYLVPSSG